MAPTQLVETEEAESEAVFEQSWEYQLYNAIRESGETGILRMNLAAKYSPFLGSHYVDRLITHIVEKYNIKSTWEHSGKSLTSRLHLPNASDANLLPAKVNP